MVQALILGGLPGRGHRHGELRLGVRLGLILPKQGLRLLGGRLLGMDGRRRRRRRILRYHRRSGQFRLGGRHGLLVLPIGNIGIRLRVFRLNAEHLLELIQLFVPLLFLFPGLHRREQGGHIRDQGLLGRHRVQGHIDLGAAPLQNQPLLLPALAGGLDSLVHRVHRLLDGVEQADQGGARQDHHADEQQQQHNDPGPKGPRRADEQLAQKASHHASAHARVGLIEGGYVVEEGQVRGDPGPAEHKSRGAEQHD